MKYDFLDPEALARLGAMPLEARHAMTGSVAGRHRSPHRGSSVEFAEYRKYVQGDDTRRLDWKAYARSDRYYIKEFEADTNLRAYFVLDASASMAFSAANDSRIQFARKLAATLSYLIINQGDAAGLSVCQEKIHLEIPPTRRAAQLNNIFDVLAKTEPTGETGLVEALHTIAEKTNQRALIIIMSDLFCDTAALQTHYSTCATASTISPFFTCSTSKSLNLILSALTALLTWRIRPHSSPSQPLSQTIIGMPCSNS